MLGGDAAPSAIANVDVSFGSSWSTRGFSSKYGFCSVISVVSKQVLDYFTSSKNCKKCERLDRSPLDKDSDEWQALKEEHNDICLRNHAVEFFCFGLSPLPPPVSLPLSGLVQSMPNGLTECLAVAGGGLKQKFFCSRCED